MTYAAPGTRSSRAVLKHSRRAPGGPEAAELTPGRCSITPEPTFPSVIHEIAACSKSEELRSSSSRGRRSPTRLRRDRRIAKVRAEREAERIAKMKADLIRIYEECKQAGVVVEVNAEDMAPDLRRLASEHLPLECLPIIPSRHHGSGSVDVIRGSPALSSTFGASSPRLRALHAMGLLGYTYYSVRKQEGLAQRIAAMQLSGQKDYAANAVDLGDSDRRQPDDPPGSRSGEGKIENTLSSIFSPQDDCCGHTPRPRSFVMVLDDRKKEKGFFGWLRKACHRGSMFVRRG